MSISLETKKAVVRPLTITIDGEPLVLAYRPNVITFAWSMELKSVGSSTEHPEEVIVGKITDAVDAWDLEYKPGEPVPLTQDALLDVPTEILTAVLKGVASAGQPGEATAGQTPAPSADFS